MSETSLSVILDAEVAVPDELMPIEEYVETVLMAAAKHLHCSGEVSVLLVDNKTIHQLNLQYRNVDRPTDVLSFPQLEGEDIGGLPNEPILLGDIVVSLPMAVQQAKDYNHSLRREFGFLLVHGFLHLLGFDHGSEEEEKEMFGLQEEILQSLQLTR